MDVDEDDAFGSPSSAVDASGGSCAAVSGAQAAAGPAGVSVAGPPSSPSPASRMPDNAMFLSGLARPRQPPPPLTFDRAVWPATPPLGSSSTGGSAHSATNSLALSPHVDLGLCVLAHAQGDTHAPGAPYAAPFTFEYGSRPASTPSRYRPLPSLAGDDASYFTRAHSQRSGLAGFDGADKPKTDQQQQQQLLLARAATIHAGPHRRRPSRTADEGEWTFQGAVVGAIHGRLKGLDIGTRLAHYGCARDVPNDLLAELARPDASLAIQCPPDFDVRALRRTLHRKLDLGRVRIYVSFVLAAFDEPCFAPRTVQFGLVGDYLNRIHRQPAAPYDPADVARAELASWLAARAQELVSGGLLAAAFSVAPPAPVPELERAGRTEPAQHAHAYGRSWSRRARAVAVDGDIFDRLAGVVHMALQQMVGLGRLSAAVASAFRNGPGVSRRAADVRRVLAAAADEWEPLLQHTDDEWAPLGVEVSRIDHPAWRALLEHRIDEAEYARQVAQYVRYVHHDYLRDIIKQKGVAIAQETIEEIFHIVTQRCEDGQLNALHMHVGVMLLRRR
ncbi:hypothetical protein Q5752_005757 [Cryptotrichosporon argae]